MRYLGLSLYLVGAFVGMSLLLGAAILVYTGGQLYWNVGTSLPSGLYGCWPLDRTLEPGQLVLLRPSVVQQALVVQVLGAKVPALWLKHVVGRIGQTVCLDDNTVLVEDTVVATRPLLAEYALGRIEGCWTVGADTIFVLGTHARSWDSRYFGPIARAQIQGICQGLWVAGEGH